VIPLLLSDFSPPPVPVALHGDLWSGNVATHKETEDPVVYDPSGYYGHGEADLGIARMFGGTSGPFLAGLFA
jgi:protein-ribulosamine 3-kinase